MRAHLALLSKLPGLGPVIAYESLHPWEGFYAESDLRVNVYGEGRAIFLAGTDNPVVIASVDGDNLKLSRGTTPAPEDLLTLLAAMGHCRNASGLELGSIDVEESFSRIKALDHAWCLLRSIRSSSVEPNQVQPQCELLLGLALEGHRIGMKRLDDGCSPAIDKAQAAFENKVRDSLSQLPSISSIKVLPDPRGSSLEVAIQGRDFPTLVMPLVFDWPVGKAIAATPIAGPAKAGSNRYAVRPTKLKPNVLGVLNSVQIDGNKVRIAQRLSKPVYDAVNEVLGALGGKWHVGQQAHVFEASPLPLITKAIEDEAVFTARDYEFFATQPNETQRVIKAARLEPGMRVLEPQAGDAALADAAAAIVGKANVTCFELMPANVKTLAAKGYDLDGPSDFLDQAPRPEFDVVILNPPFSQGRDMAHIRHAIGFVKPGGRLVAIASRQWRTSTTKPCTSFRELLASLGASIENIEGGAFHAVGTDVETSLITLTMPSQALANQQPSILPSPAQIEANRPNIEREQFALF